jgi:hypothetical protein
MFAIKLAFAGLGHLIAHWSIGIIVIAACVAAELFLGAITAYLPLLKPLTRQIQIGLIVLGTGTALVLFGEWLGASDMASRCDAKAAVVQGAVTKAVTKPVTGNDPWDTDQ